MAAPLCTRHQHVTLASPVACLKFPSLQDEKVAAEGGSQELSVAELPVDALTTVEQVQTALDDPGVSKTRKQKLKQRLKALQVCECSW